MLKNEIVFDATKDYIFEFNAFGGDQIFKNQIKIAEIETNKIVYDNTIESFQLEHLIPKNTLKNKTEYKIQIKTYNVDNDSSEWSEYCIASCWLQPIVSIINLEKDTGGNTVIRNQTYNFQGSIITDGDEIQSYEFILYDYEGTVLGTSPNLFNNKLQYEFTGLENERKYYIELKVLTQHNVEVTSGLVLFTPVYIKPRIKNVLNLANDYKNAQIKIESKVIQVLFRKLDGEISYEESEWINLKKGSIIANDKDGFEVHGDWSLKMYVRNLEYDKPFVILSDTYESTIDFRIYDNKIHIFKKQGKSIYHIFTPPLNNIDWEKDTIVIFAQKIGESMNIKAEKVTWALGC